MVNVNSAKEIIELFENSSNTDTRKGLNRAPNKMVPTTVCESIEINGITSEELIALKMPVYKYLTQVTVHGLFSVSNLRIGTYKNLILNGNGSLGIKYTAIDYERKMFVRTHCGLLGWNHVFNSTSSRIIHTTAINSNSEEHFKVVSEMYRQVLLRVSKVTNFVGRYNLRAGNLYGKIYVWCEIEMLAFLGDAHIKLMEAFSGKTFAEIEKLIEAKRLEEEKREEQYKAERIAREERAVIRRAENIKKLKEQGYKPTKIEGGELSGYVLESNGILKYVHIKKEGRQKMYRWSSDVVRELGETKTFSDYLYNKLHNEKLIIFTKK